MQARPPRYRVERSPQGYRVVGPALLIWEPSLGEALGRRDEIEGGAVHHAPGREPVGAAHFAAGSVYGPIESRRLGRSLGISLTPPGRRVCDLDCVYCAWGGHAAVSPEPAPWPRPSEIAAALSRALPCAGRLDSITISGFGEPTLHPEFPAVVGAIRGAAAARPGVPLRILTNAARAWQPAIRAALERLDERIVKIDAAPERIERPASRAALALRLATIAQLADVTVQACFVAGAVPNTDPASVGRWLDRLADLRPRAVQLYTIDLPAARPGVLPVTREQLEEIACRLRARTGIEASLSA